MPSEFELIRRFFTRPVQHTELGVGDDAALIRVAAGMELAVSADMLVEGRHFSPGDGPGALGHKTLAVNLSDLAAMGATPRWATLALALPAADEKWLQGFAGGFFGLAQKYKVDLIGGDTTRGPLTLCVQIMGEVPAGQALRRSGARPGDDIWVSGVLGDAALALAFRQGQVKLEQREAAACLPKLYLPAPRVELGCALLGIASSTIDISDGLLADLGHILEASRAAAEIRFDDLPKSAVLRAHLGDAAVRDCLLAGGDDYELCFTAPAERRATLAELSARLDLPLTRIGTIRGGAGLALLDGAGQAMATQATGYDHFA